MTFDDWWETEGRGVLIGCTIKDGALEAWQAAQAEEMERTKALVEALDRINEATLSQFFDYRHLAIWCKDIARAAIARYKGEINEP